MDILPEDLIRLNARIDTLEQRVFILEHAEHSTALPSGEAVPIEITLPQIAERSSFAEAGANFSTFGKAMLGMAGAYVLRAIAESGSLPRPAVAVLAIAYAGMWLAWAAWIPEQQWFSSAIYAGTSALIFAPMLWELTLRFGVLTPAITAAVLGGFAAGAYALAWRRNLVPVVWVGVLTTAVASISLLIATRQMVPFITVLLLMALLTETASSHNHWMGVRPVAAAAADCAVWSMIFIYSNPGTSRADYAPLSTAALLLPGILLLTIYGTSAGLRSVLHGKKITLFEAAQSMAAFALMGTVVLRFGPQESAPLLGVFCLVLAPACYVAALVRFSDPRLARNYFVYSTWGFALLLTGGFLCLAPTWLAAVLGAAAILATLVGAQQKRVGLEVHGFVFLVAAASASGMLQYSAQALVGVFPKSPPAIGWMVSAAAILCYALSGITQGAARAQRVFQTLSATLALGAVATALVSALVWITETVVTPGEAHVAVIRTLAGCALALALAYLGPRWRRIELVWVTYGSLGLIAAKLLLEDLRQGHPEFIAASIFVYAVTLMLVPGVVRRTSKKLTGIQASGD